MDPVLLSATITSALELAAKLSSLAMRDGALSDAEVQALWERASSDWNRDWAEWMARRQGAPE